MKQWMGSSLRRVTEYFNRYHRVTAVCCMCGHTSAVDTLNVTKLPLVKVGLLCKASYVVSGEFGCCDHIGLAHRHWCRLLCRLSRSASARHFRKCPPPNHTTAARLRRNSKNCLSCRTAPRGGGGAIAGPLLLTVGAGALLYWSVLLYSCTSLPHSWCGVITKTQQA